MSALTVPLGPTRWYMARSNVINTCNVIECNCPKCSFRVSGRLTAEQWLSWPITFSRCSCPERPTQLFIQHPFIQLQEFRLGPMFEVATAVSTLGIEPATSAITCYTASAGPAQWGGGGGVAAVGFCWWTTAWKILAAVTRFRWPVWSTFPCPFGTDWDKEGNSGMFHLKQNAVLSNNPPCQLKLGFETTW